MRIERIQKRNFAFGLTWVEVPDGLKASQTVLDALDYVRGVVHVSQSATDATATVVGYAKPAAAKGPLFSYAATLATAGTDGVFVAILNDGAYWFTVIRGGLVVPGTDRVGDLDEIMSAASAMSASLGMPLIAGPGVPHGDGTFDLVQAIAGVRKPKALVVVESSGKVALAAVIMVAVMGGLGYAAYRMVVPARDAGAQSQADLERIAREAWVSKVQGLAGNISSDAAWASRAFTDVVGHYPPQAGGWSVEGVVCTPAGCDVQYVAPAGGGVSAVSPLREQFGPALGAASADGKSRAVRFPFVSSSIRLDESALRVMRKSATPMDDIAGLISLNVPSAEMDGPSKATPIAGAPPGFPELLLEKVAIKGAAVDPATMSEAVSYWATAGFVPVKMAWSHGWSTVPRAWRIEFVRLSAAN